MIMNLTQQYQPTEQDILCRRGKAFKKHPGNIAFSSMIESHLQQYVALPTRIERGMLVAELRSKLFESGARFFKQDKTTNSWQLMDEESSHEKIRQTIRDSLRKQKKNAEKTSSRSKFNQAKQKLATKPHKACVESVESQFLYSDHIRRACLTASLADADNVQESRPRTHQSFRLSANIRASVCLTHDEHYINLSEECFQNFQF